MRLAESDLTAPGHPFLARDLRHPLKNTLMAAKVRMLKLLQEIRGFAEIVNRCPPPRPPGVLVAQMRPHIIQAAIPRRTLRVTMVERDSADSPRPVKINYVKQTPPPVATLPAS
jgi:hypothetical protein